MIVNILCPNGRRQAVKVTLNSTILQILDEVCLKRGFDSAKHDLKHGRNTLDVSLTFRFSGISNNGKLELVEREKPRSSTTHVTIALQLDSGERRHNTFHSDCCLADMVKQFQQAGEDLLHLSDLRDQHPIIVNMREEIIGLALLEHTTLQSIGLVSGRVALRLIYRPVEQSLLDCIATQIHNDMMKSRKHADVAVTSPSSQQHAGGNTASNPQMIPHPPQEPSPLPQAQTCDEPIDVSSHSTHHLAVSVSKPSTQQANTVLESTSSTLHAIHTVAETDSHVAMDDTPAPTTAVTDTVTDHYSEPTAVENQMVVRPRIVSPPLKLVNPPLPVAEFKFPVETAGKDLYNNDISDAQPKVNYLPCDREVMVFSMDEPGAPQQPLAVENLPDDFFEVTNDDLQKTIRHLRDQASQEDNAPLLTASMRQARLEDTYSKYEFSVVRFYFPDKMVLQAKFRPRETVHSLSKFVKSHLRDQSQNFHLYTTPPKKVFDDPAVTLIVANLVPMAIVYVSLSKTSVRSKEDCSLCDGTLTLKQSKLTADCYAKQSLPEQVSRQPFQNSTHSTVHSGSTSADPNQPIPSSSRSRGSANNTASASSNAGRQLPKWYKPSGK